LGADGELAADPAGLQPRIVLLGEPALASVMTDARGRVNPSGFAWFSLAVGV
jgi:hypothetical protein